MHWTTIFLNRTVTGHTRLEYPINNPWTRTTNDGVGAYLVTVNRERPTDLWTKIMHTVFGKRQSTLCLCVTLLVRVVIGLRHFCDVWLHNITKLSKCSSVIFFFCICLKPRVGNFLLFRQNANNLMAKSKQCHWNTFDLNQQQRIREAREDNCLRKCCPTQPFLPLFQ